MAVLFSLFVTLAAFGAPKHAEPAWRGEWRGFAQLLAVLDSVPEGRVVLQKARAKDPNFLDHIHQGEASYTESTFARTYSLLDGKETIELKHEVTINQRLPLGEAAVDLAHELVHFSEKEMLDPYKPGFQLVEFIRQGIEGQGGELQALKRECLVAWALERRFTRFPQHPLCAAYRTPSGAFDQEQAIQDYYALGTWKPSERLAKAIPELTRHMVVFTSSYARKPYPIALTEEFDSTLKMACANNRKKYRLIAAQAESGRAPAANLLTEEQMRLKSYEQLYCKSGPSKRLSTEKRAEE